MCVFVCPHAWPMIYVVPKVPQRPSNGLLSPVQGLLLVQIPPQHNLSKLRVIAFWGDEKGITVTKKGSRKGQNDGLIYLAGFVRQNLITAETRFLRARKIAVSGFVF